MKPYFSICIPQYNRTDFLVKACRSFAKQTFRDFDVCISDDLSTDGKEEMLQSYLAGSGLRYSHRRNATNLRYDGNLRSAIAMSTGSYLLLMGNDDRLSSPDTLAYLRELLEENPGVAVAIANYRELSSGRIFRRMRETRVLGSGPETAASVFRNYSFVSGVILSGDGARSEATAELDGSEMYQMYLGTRLVARGGRFLAIDRIVVDKDIQIPGQDVDSYRKKPRLSPCPIMRRPLPMGRLLEVVAYALRPCVDAKTLDRLLYSSARSLYSFTYPFWGIEYKRAQSVRYALGVLWALDPSTVAKGQGLSSRSVLALWPIYLATSAGALLVPTWLFDRLQPLFYRLAKAGPQ
jgi:hypothetical protein